jgi:hypothetical protein
MGSEVSDPNLYYSFIGYSDFSRSLFSLGILRVVHKTLFLKNDEPFLNEIVFTCPKKCLEMFVKGINSPILRLGASCVKKSPFLKIDFVHVPINKNSHNFFSYGLTQELCTLLSQE